MYFYEYFSFSVRKVVMPRVKVDNKYSGPGTNGSRCLAFESKLCQMLRPLPLTYLSDQALWVSNAESNQSSIEANKSSEMCIAAQITNRPFYRCVLSRLTFE